MGRLRLSTTDLLGGRDQAGVRSTISNASNARCRFRFRGYWRPTHNEPSKRRLKADFVNFDPADIFPLVAGHWVPSMRAVKVLCTLVAVHYPQFGDGAAGGSDAVHCLLEQLTRRIPVNVATGRVETLVE